MPKIYVLSRCFSREWLTIKVEWERNFVSTLLWKLHSLIWDSWTLIFIKNLILNKMKVLPSLLPHIPVSWKDIFCVYLKWYFVFKIFYSVNILCGFYFHFCFCNCSCVLRAVYIQNKSKNRNKWIPKDKLNHNIYIFPLSDLRVLQLLG